MVIHPFEGGHGFALLFPDAQFVIHDAIVLDNQPVAQKRRLAELAEQGSGELLERIGENDDLHERPEFIQKFPAARQRTQRTDDVLDVG